MVGCRPAWRCSPTNTTCTSQAPSRWSFCLMRCAPCRTWQSSLARCWAPCLPPSATTGRTRARTAWPPCCTAPRWWPPCGLATARCTAAQTSRPPGRWRATCAPTTASACRTSWPWCTRRSSRTRSTRPMAGSSRPTFRSASGMWTKTATSATTTCSSPSGKPGTSTSRSSRRLRPRACCSGWRPRCCAAACPPRHSSRCCTAATVRANPANGRRWPRTPTPTPGRPARPPGAACLTTCARPWASTARATRSTSAW